MPTISDDWDDPEGVVIDAIIFGGRRASNVPLVVEARDWKHGVFLGATISSEQTAAAEGSIGELRRDPFAMLPFCGYNMADYWAHWLEMGRMLADFQPPRIFQVNWFRKGSDGRYLWPGFAENSRVIAWMMDRVDGSADAVDTPLGWAPAPGALDLDGLDLSPRELGELFEIDSRAWLAEMDGTADYFGQFGDRVPAELDEELERIIVRLDAADTSRDGRATTAAVSTIGR